ncbi:SDR family oxidoreductase [Telluribacter sp. SYSU D00476]|uniref:SDR family oxidoreductase n=1 Tax=Telluribacter sp. SYSU D00476 TaxID=2811430 RepID=UPI001FF19006|nr:SDR family oxidoreductase [Telluribacter sp. SYSU D00476]
MSIVLITGCSTGIGFSTAETLARSGHTIYATMRNPQSAPQLAELAKRDSLPLIVLRMDVDSDESVLEATNQVLMQAGHIDVLINNAGIAPPLKPIEETPAEDFRRTMETNYFGTVRCIQAVLPTMRERRSGLIINVSSVAGKLHTNFMGAYCASKAAVESLSESLACEVQPFGIRVAVVQPGVIETPIVDKLNVAPAHTNYTNLIRQRAFFSASKDNHVQPFIVGDVIRDIIDNANNARMRYPVGPDSLPLLGYRASLTDEDWVASAGVDEDTWAAGMGQLGLNVRKYL